MSAGISGSYTVLSAATMSAVSCSSSSGGIDEPGTGVAATGIGSAVTSGVSAILVSIISSTLEVIPAKAGIHATIVLAPDAGVGSRLRGNDAIASPKEVARLDQRLGQGVHLGLGIIHGERGAAGGRDPEPVHQRLGAMVACAHRHTRTVDDGGDVVRVQPIDAEGDDGALVLGGAMDLEPIELAQAGVRIVPQLGLVTGDALAADLQHVVEGGAEADRLHDRRRAGFELVWRYVIVDGVLVHAPDHLAA